MRRRDSCPLCGVGVGSAVPFATTGRNYRLVRCVACGMVYGVDVLEPSEYDAVYDDAYAGKYDDPALVAQNRAYADRFFADRERGKVLEIGCGTGAFLERLAEMGFKCAGVEASAAAAARARARGLLVTARPFEMIADPGEVGGPFDLVVTFHVLEHVLDPVAFAAQIARFLRPGGTWFNYMPYVAAWRPEDHGPEWIHFMPTRAEEHVNFFDDQTLNRLATQTGFAVWWFGSESDDFWMWAERKSY